MASHRATLVGLRSLGILIQGPETNGTRLYATRSCTCAAGAGA